MNPENQPIALDTPICEFEMPAKLVNRLNLLRIRTFAEIMAVNPKEWDDVNPKVVNAPRRFQQSHAKLYQRLAPSPAHLQAPSPNDERRFFVANNILNALVASGELPLSADEAKPAMREIMRMADAFLHAYDRPEDSWQ